MTSIHDKISAFLQERAIVFNEKEQGSPLTKAGLIPYDIREGVFHYYVMTPIAKRPELELPAFQFAKGTRMRRTPTGWVDMHGSMHTDDEREPLPATALREAIEELGLVLENVKTLHDVGIYEFSSAATGKVKYMQLFAASVEDPAAFSEDRDVAFTTASRRWLTLQQFERLGRADYRPILAQIEKRLQAHIHASD